ncbi:MAG: hypothetical protein Q4C98_11190 [Capnocytophaga sp.]|nr:hypothetical protein [Capnocytophaga sp.]
MCQHLVAVLVGIDVGISAFVVILLHHFATVPNEYSAFGVGGFQATFGFKVI